MFGTVPATTAIRATEDRRIAVVASELLGRPGTGGAGTADSLLAVALGRHGYSVDLIVASGREIGALNEEWRRIYDDAAVRITVLQPLPGVGPAYLRPSFEVLQALAEIQPDVAIVNDWRALGWSALRARQVGLDLTQTAFIVHCHGPGRVLVEFAQKVPDTVDRFGESVAERAALELADAVVSPSAWLVDWFRTHRWALPDSVHVIQYIRQSAALEETVQRLPADGPVRRLVFFGQLREGKGIRIFLDALDRLDPVEVVFLGAASKRWPREELLRRVPGARVENELTREGALAELSQPGTLAVMPSLLDNSPNTVAECIERGIPFVATDTGGIAELVAEEDRARVLCAPTARDLAEALRRAVGAPTFPAARPAEEPAESLRAWLELVATVRHEPAQRRRAPLRVGVVAASEPSAESARRLAGATHAVEVEVTISESRRAGVERTAADWIVFLEDGDDPDDELIDTLVTAQTQTGADVVTAAVRSPDGVRLFLGDAGALGLVENQYGAIGLVRASLAVPLLEEDTADDPDWLLFARLALDGARIVPVPKALAAHSGPIGRIGDVPGPGLRILEAFEAPHVVPLHDLPQLAATLAAALQHSPAAPSAPAGNGMLRRAARKVVR
jgi:glycosyltransferase involved in cell wall biosynthesis